MDYKQPRTLTDDDKYRIAYMLTTKGLSYLVPEVFNHPIATIADIVYRCTGQTLTNYLKVKPMTFSEALVAVKRGYLIQRAGWNGKGLWAGLQKPDEQSKMTLPYLYIQYPPDATNTPGALVPWLASQTDILAEDWKVL